MRFASMALLAATVALPACQAPPAGQQALTGPGAGAPACPAPGSTVQLLRSDTGQPVSVLNYLQPGGAGEDGLCVIRSGPDRRAMVNIVGRRISPDAQREHARMQSELTGLRVGSTSSGFAILPESAGLRSVQFQISYEVLRDERVTVPAGTFDTVVVEQRDRNESCLATWTAWLDRATHLPVKVHSEAVRCLQVRQFDAVAGTLKRT